MLLAASEYFAMPWGIPWHYVTRAPESWVPSYPHLHFHLHHLTLTLEPNPNDMKPLNQTQIQSQPSPKHYLTLTLTLCLIIPHFCLENTQLTAATPVLLLSNHGIR